MAETRFLPAAKIVWHDRLDAGGEAPQGRRRRPRDPAKARIASSRPRLLLLLDKYVSKALHCLMRQHSAKATVIALIAFGG